MEERRWEWRLADGEEVVAVVDAGDTSETVLLDGAVASRAPRGAGAHEIAAKRVSVTFDPRFAICVLRVDGHEVAPLRWPSPRPRPRAKAPAPRAWGALLVIGAALVVCAAGALFALRARAGAHVDPSWASHRAASGLFVAHAPASFTASPARVPPPLSGLALEADSGTVLLLAAAGPEQDPWSLLARAEPEALAALARADGTYEEHARADGVCLGERGAVVTARIKNARGEPARMWACAFAHGEASYVFVTSTSEAGGHDDELRTVVDRTELTHLGPVSDTP